MLKIGHRGASGYEPENTLASFQKAIELHVDQIELDVHLSADDELMVIHDETIDRVTDESGQVKEFTVPELKRFRIDKKHDIPTLSEVLDLVDQKCGVNIEIKSFEATEKVVELIEEYVDEKRWNYNQFIVSSFNWNALEQVYILNPSIRIAVLTETNLDLAVAFAETILATAVNPYFHLLTAENTAEIQTAGFLVFPWTVNETEDIKKMKSFNVDGIISDFPDRI